MLVADFVEEFIQGLRFLIVIDTGHNGQFVLLLDIIDQDIWGW